MEVKYDIKIAQKILRQAENINPKPEWYENMIKDVNQILNIAEAILYARKAGKW